MLVYQHTLAQEGSFGTNNETMEEILNSTTTNVTLPHHEPVVNNWHCSENVFNHTPYMCVNASRPKGLHPSMPDVWSFHSCYVNVSTLVDFTGPALDECDSFCVLGYNLTETGFQDFCKSCSLTATGDIAYDCSNLFPDGECPERNTMGNCDSYASWICVPAENSTVAEYACFGCLRKQTTRNNSLQVHVPVLHLHLLYNSYHERKDSTNNGPLFTDTTNPDCALLYRAGPRFVYSS